MEEIIVLAFVGLLVIAFVISRKIQQDISKLETQVAEDLKDLMSKVVFLRTETHNDLILAYNAMTNDFVCQGKDMEELNKNFGLRYPTARGVIVQPESTEALQ